MVFMPLCAVQLAGVRIRGSKHSATSIPSVLPSSLLITTTRHGICAEHAGFLPVRPCPCSCWGSGWRNWILICAHNPINESIAAVVKRASLNQEGSGTVILGAGGHDLQSSFNAASTVRRSALWTATPNRIYRWRADGKHA